MTNQARALRLISDYFCEEYGDGEVDIYDLYRVPIAYTTDDEGNALQVYADLMNYRLIYTRGGEVVATDNYDNYEEYERLALTQLDFDELIAHCNGNFGEV